MLATKKWIVSLVATILAAGSLVSAEPVAWDGFAESEESYAAAEAERQYAVRRQVQLNDLMRWRAGFPPANGVFYYPLPPSLEYAYATGQFFGLGYGADFWGYRHIPISRQPIGRVEVQTGPNRWE